MLAFLINPTTETIEVVEHDGDYKNIQKLIGASLFTTVCIKYDEDKGVSTDIYVDDEGMLSLTADTKFIKFDNYPYPLAGNGLVLGCDIEGESIAPMISKEELEDSVSFMDFFEVREYTMKEGI